MLKGIKQATIVNTIGTIVKIVPLVLFILILLFVFKFSHFDFDFWGESVATKAKLGSLSTQIKSTMLVTLWAFIGIEGAVVMSNRAKNIQEVGQATLLGFVGCLIIYVLLSLLPYGLMSQERLAAVANPSTAGILEQIVGPWGGLVDEYRLVGISVNQLACLDHGNGSDSSGCRSKRNFSQSLYGGK